MFIIFDCYFIVECRGLQWIPGYFYLSLFHLYFCTFHILVPCTQYSPFLVVPVIGDGDHILFSCTHIYSKNTEDAIGINVKSDSSLRNNTG